ncbi:MAG TPA: ferric reductase-like transmembrane domain-containing protein [Cyclobacteriaceae bacterium]|nr:ferric reductase-like transmembrane domain-containing protein [Cyclobacteriaceae bacterium]
MPLIILSAIAGYIFYLTWQEKDTITIITDATGYISLILLVITLILGPLNILFKRKNPVSTYFRRDLGIYGGSLAVVHSAAGLFVHLRGKPWLYFFIESDNTLSIRFDRFGIANHTGLFGALIIILLLVISNDFSLKKLKTSRWKNLQRLSYFMFIFIMIHSILYRVSANDNHLIFYLYIPLFLFVLIVQLAGLKQRTGIRNNQL